MRIFLVVLHTLGCLFLITAVLLQSGRGGGVGAAFAGASGQIFGGRGASSFLVRITSGAAALFFVTSLSLSMVSSRHRSVLQGAIPAAESPVSSGSDQPALGGEPDGADDKPAATDKPAAPDPAAPADGAAAPADAAKPAPPRDEPPAP